MIQQVFEYLQYNVGTPCTLDDICNMLGCPREQVCAALETLAAAGHIQRHQQRNGVVTYTATGLVNVSLYRPRCRPGLRGRM